MTVLVAISDFFCFQVSLALGYLLWVRLPWHGNWQFFNEYMVMLWILPPVALIVFKSIGLYKPGMGVIGVQEQSLIFKGIWIVYFLVFALSFFYRDASLSRLATLYSMFISIVVISFERFLFRRIFSWLNHKGIANRHALIYGAGYHGVRLERWIRQSPQLGIHVVGYLDDQTHMIKKLPEFPPILGGIEQLKDIAEREDISLFFIGHRSLKEEKVIEMIQICRDLKIQCWVIPSLYRFHVEHVEMQNIGGIPLLGFRQQFGRRSYEFMKYCLDVALALILLAITLPLWIIVGVGTYMTLGSPIFFKQVRIGKDHKKFTMYKFRTMRKGKRRDDISPELQKDTAKYITPFGAFLRRSGLDEIPQLFNVLKGDMSLVGPRPEMPFLVEKYTPLERERLTVKPGVTGLWQISEDRKRLLIHENMDYDLYYCEHMSFNLDLAILFKTLIAVLKRFKDKTKET